MAQAVEMGCTNKPLAKSRVPCNLCRGCTHYGTTGRRSVMRTTIPYGYLILALRLTQMVCPMVFSHVCKWRQDFRPEYVSSKREEGERIELTGRHDIHRLGLAVS